MKNILKIVPCAENFIIYKILNKALNILLFIKLSLMY